MRTSKPEPSRGRLTRRTIFFTVSTFLFVIFGLLVWLAVWGDGSQHQQQLVDKGWNLFSGGLGSLLTLLATKGRSD
jgi:hypothetical protein